MTLDPQDLRILSAVRNSKLQYRERNHWASAMDLAGAIRRPPAEIARAMRDLCLRGYLEQADEAVMYGSSKDPIDTRYGLTTRGATMAQYFDTPVGKFDLLKRQILQTMKRHQLETRQATITLGSLQTSLNNDQTELIRALQDLQGEGYVDKPFFPEATPDQDHYNLTAIGYQVASYLERGNDWPIMGNGTGMQSNTTNYFNGPNSGVIQLGNNNTGSITNNGGMSAEIMSALKELEARIQSVPDLTIREEGKFHADRITRTIEAGQSPETPMRRLTDWLTATGQQVTGAAVIWSAASAVGSLVGIHLPPPPPNLGQ